MKQYHTEIGFPETIQIPTGRIDFTLGDHVKKMSDKRAFEIPQSVYLIDDDIVEIKTKDGNIWRILARIQYTDSKDICLVFNMKYKLITAWLIDSDDTHETLDKTLYEDV